MPIKKVYLAPNSPDLIDGSVAAPSASLTSMIRPAWSLNVSVVSAVISTILLDPACINPLFDTTWTRKS